MITGLSDHNLVLVARKLTSKRFGVPTVNKQESCRIPNKEQKPFENKINSFNWNGLLAGKELNEGSKIFSNKIQSFITEFTRKFKNRPIKNNLPWINADILKIMKERDAALKKAIKTKLSHDKHYFVMLRNKVTTLLRKSKANFFLTIISEARGNSKLIWDQLKKLMGQEHKARKPLELCLDGNKINDPADVAASLNHYFVDSVATIAHRILRNV